MKNPAINRTNVSVAQSSTLGRCLQGAAAAVLGASLTLTGCVSQPIKAETSWGYEKDAAGQVQFQGVSASNNGDALKQDGCINGFGWGTVISGGLTIPFYGLGILVGTPVGTLIGCVNGKAAAAEAQELQNKLVERAYQDMFAAGYSP
jgi:hypothetical protein